ncbi:MAG TPA: aminotransferase class I/II-fold pyridoxal phosphate-dependent enzyme [Candidatus Nitrosocosmicus sp.]|nr:aminotransferase class I/II-fold pyridoxal phosphate-dependent enzyme [Candidatus Nitrosocosmicus sp.]
MSKLNFFSLLNQEVANIDEAKTSKRNEKVIEKFTSDQSPKAIINGREIRIFNSNDYLGLRHHPSMKEAEHNASQTFGTGPGAVRFISGSLQIYTELEEKIASFHHREAGMIFSSAFATNLAVLFCLIKGQTKNTVVDPDVLVISDALNHRSIIDGIRIANLPSENKAIFNHLDTDHLEQILKENLGKYKRVLIITDGVFSMLGEYQKLKEVRRVVNEYDSQYELGTLLIVDDAHGVGIAGKTGRGTEEVEEVQADVLIGTFGKAFGADGGYVVANREIIQYLRESAATYIYSNPFSPGTAGAALQALHLIDQKVGKNLLEKSKENTEYFKKQMSEAGFKFAAQSSHPIQPILIGDPEKTQLLTAKLFEKNVLVTQISYPVVPQGRDEIRAQISAAHTKEDLDYVIQQFKDIANEMKLL